MSLAAGTSAGFRYVAPASERPSFVAVGDERSLVRTLGRLAPPGMKVRLDRRVDGSAPVERTYPDWRSLLWGVGLAGDIHGDELHVRPAGLDPARVELLSPDRGRRSWAVRAGETLAEVLSRWGENAGVEIVVLTDRRWRIEQSRAFRNRTFDEACAALLVGLSHMPHPPAAERVGDVLSVMHRLPKTENGR